MNIKEKRSRDSSGRRRSFDRPVPGLAFAAVALLAGIACGPTEQRSESTPTAGATDTRVATRTPRAATETIATAASTVAETVATEEATTGATPSGGDCVGRCVATAIPPTATPLPDPVAGGAPMVPPLRILTFSAGDTLTFSDLALRGYGEPGRGPFPGTRMIIPAIGVDAALETHVVGANGVMPRASTPQVVAWYDFSAWPGLGGVPLGAATASSPATTSRVGRAFSRDWASCPWAR